MGGRHLDTRVAMQLLTDGIDQVAFAAARERVALEERLSEGFSVYAERAVHKTFKLYLEPRAEYHEVPVMGSVADIFNEQGITEVQTGSFAPLLPKLRRLLPHYRVTLVHPFAIHTAHRWLDPETGEITSPASRGTQRSLYSVGRELYSLRELIDRAGLEIVVIAYDCEEFRRLDGWDKTKKRGATLLGKLPTRLEGELRLKAREDYRVFLPERLPECFTRAEYLRAIKSRSRYDGVNIKLLEHLGGLCGCFEVRTELCNSVFALGDSALDICENEVFILKK